MHKKTGIWVTLAVTTMLSAAGCGSDKTDDSSVATLASRPAAVTGSAAAATNPAAGRPEFRLDMTEAERWRMLQVWYHCLKDAGAPTYAIKGTKLENQPGVQAGDIMPQYTGYIYTDPRLAEPRRKCVNQEPREPAELDPKRNPHYADQFKAEIDCIRKAGFEVSVLKDPDGSDDLQISLNNNGKDPAKVENDCKLKAFAQ